jgi:heme a synthase
MPSATMQPLTHAGADRSLQLCARWFLALAIVTLGQIVLGGMVRAHGAGLACPDWPLCFGKVLPQMDFKVAYEWGHRALAGLVSLGLGAGTLLVWLRARALRGPIGRLLAIAWGILAIQVVLGGLTVLLRLEPWTVTAHLLMGTAFCVVVIWIAWDLAERTQPAVQRVSVSPAVATSVIATAAVLVAQIALGGVVASHGAGLACASFPTCDGSAFVPTLHGLQGVAVLHRLNAALLIVALGGLVWALRSASRLYALAWLAFRLAVLQAGFGVLNVLLRIPVEMTALHSAAAAGLVLIVARLVREVMYGRAAGRDRAPERAVAPAAATSPTSS